MSDNDIFHYSFIHNVFGCFIENTLEYFGDYFYPRFQHKIVSTYDKGVQYIINLERDGKEVDKPNLPALILSPNDFNLDDANAGGKQFWRFPHLAPGLANLIFDPVYLDKNVEVNIAFTRLKGEIELLALLPSYYEYFDLKIFILQMFGGEGRYIQPMFFNDFIILPPELVNYRYENEYTKESYILDWKTNGAYDFLVETTNKNELVMPGKIKPRYVLRGISDGSTRYGGPDDIADWKLSTIIEYEIEIPSYLILKTNFSIEDINFNIGYGSVYSKYSGFNIPTSEFTINVHTESGLQDNFNTVFNEKGEGFVVNLNGNIRTSSIDNDDLLDDGYGLNYQSTPPISLCDGGKIRREIVFKTRYFHIVTQEQENSIEDVIIAIPEKVYDISLIKVQSKYGLMEYGAHYIIEPTSDEIRIKVNHVELKKGDFIEIFIYEVPSKDKNIIFLTSNINIKTSIRNLYDRAVLNVDWAFTSTAKCKSKVDGTFL